MESSLRIVAITNCPAGIAHTYMVAEALEQKARSLGYTIKVETQGSSGVENRLSSEEIAAADYVILATGRGLSGDDRARFAGKKVYEIAISQALKNIDQIFSELPTNSQLFAADSGVKLGKQEVQSGSVMSHLMAGVSAALPFVIGGGILVALANMLVQFGLPYTDMSKGAPSFTWVVESIGYLGFTFMIPIMGAYIASSIADKPVFRSGVSGLLSGERQSVARHPVWRGLPRCGGAGAGNWSGAEHFIHYRPERIVVTPQSESRTTGACP